MSGMENVLVHQSTFIKNSHRANLHDASQHTIKRDVSYVFIYTRVYKMYFVYFCSNCKMPMNTMGNFKLLAINI